MYTYLKYNIQINVFLKAQLALKILKSRPGPARISRKKRAWALPQSAQKGVRANLASSSGQPRNPAATLTNGIAKFLHF